MISTFQSTTVRACLPLTLLEKKVVHYTVVGLLIVVVIVMSFLVFTFLPLELCNEPVAFIVDSCGFGITLVSDCDKVQLRLVRLASTPRNVDDAEDGVNEGVALVDWCGV